jgi:hypothetical protein
MHMTFLRRQNIAEYKHPCGELSVFRIEMAGLRTKRLRIANLPLEIHEGTLRSHLAPYGEIRAVQEEKKSNIYRNAVANVIRIISIALTKLIPSYLTIVGHCVLVSYDGQP